MLKFYHLSDLHYFSKSNYRCDPYAIPRQVDQIAYRETDLILKRTVDLLLEDKEIDIVIITGDLAAFGDLDSHEAVQAELRRLRDGGKRVYAYVASHDFPWDGKCIYYDEKGTRLPLYDNFASFEKANSFYREFGYDGALAQNSENYSFVVQLDEHTRYMALCVDYYEGHAPMFNDNSLAWIRTQAQRAKEDGVELIASCHHPILAPSPIYALMGKIDIMFEHENLRETFTQLGIRLLFTGHTHMHDIEFHVGENGKVLYDVATAALSGFPPVYRKIAFDAETDTVDVKTCFVDRVESKDIKIDDLTAYCREGFIGFVEKMIAAMGTDIDRFAEMGVGISLNPDDVKKKKWLLKPIGKFLNKLTFGKLARWTKKETGFKKADYEAIKDERVVPLLVHCVERLYGGDADVSPDNPKFKIMMGLAAIIDDLVRTLKIDLKSKLGVATLSEVLEPILYNNGAMDIDATLNLNQAPTPKQQLPKLKSNKGILIILFSVLATLILLPLLVPCGIIIALIILLKKLFKGEEKAVEEKKEE